MVNQITAVDEMSMGQLKLRILELEDYVNNAAVGLHWVDKDGMIVWANQAELNMLGYTESEYIGRHISEFHAERSVIDDILRRLGNKETLNQYESQLRCKDGSLKTVHITSNVFFNEDEFVHTRCFTTDVTHEKKLLASLVESEKKYRQLIENLPVAFYTCDADGFIQIFNTAAADLWGRIPEQGKDLWCGSWKIYTTEGEPLPFSECPMAIALKTGKPVLGEHIIVEKPSGERTFIQPHPYPFLNENGKVSGAMNVLIDISNIKKVQKALSDLLKQKNEFLSIASHELKTPITILKAYTQLLAERPDSYKKEIDNIYNKMNTQVNRLSFLIHDLLDVTKIQEGVLAYSKEKMNLSETVIEVAQEMRQTTSTHSIVLAEIENAEIMGDEKRISQVVSNLVSNAIKYSPNGTQINIRLTAEANHVLCSVQDFGFGIPSDQQDKVFQKFYRVNGQNSHTFPGMGLGLYIVEDIIIRHDGKIWLQSEEGKGSTFSFRLPTIN
ncbi:MAG: ATP-binding protein [Panacibacter sp.]